MACYHPIPAYHHGPCGTVDLWPPLGGANLDLPCGGCVGCKQDRATDWARRATHEATQWEHNCFLTLTYNDEHLPSNGGLVPKDLSDFFKRLRRYRDYGNRELLSDRAGSVRYLAAGEYGERKHRPHYHALIFNGAFKDAYPVAGNLMESPTLAKLWPLGDHKIGTLTGASANYVAQYTLKNIGRNYHTDDGEVLVPPYIRMSTCPALGTKFLTKYKNDLSQGYLVSDGTKGRVPRAYKKKLVQTDLMPGRQGPQPGHYDPPLAEQIIFKASSHPHREVNHEAAEKIHLARLRQAQLKRG